MRSTTASAFVNETSNTYLDKTLPTFRVGGPVRPLFFSLLLSFSSSSNSILYMSKQTNIKKSKHNGDIITS